MRVGIDASNLRGGGGITHLRALIEATDPARDGIERVTVWAGRGTLDQLPDLPWLDRALDRKLDGSLLSRTNWRRRCLPRLAKEACDVLLAPGGLCTAGFRPVVTMSRNMLPFEFREMLRFAPSRIFARTLLLRGSLSRSFRRADGVIFLSDYARTRVQQVTGVLRKTATISHGVNSRFFREPRPQRPITEFTAEQPYHILYSSIIDMYKHQWQVVRAVAMLRDEGFPVSLELIGPKYPPAYRRVERAIRETGSAAYIGAPGAVPHDELHSKYHGADLFVFASSCENLPNILLEAMAAGLPVACSNRGPMPEVLGPAGTYFKPTDVDSIASAVRKLLQDPDLRARNAVDSFRRVQGRSWDRCAEETWRFVRHVLSAHRKTR
jgi:glycosyltransferase involved in cell wall biosynthesis